MENKYSQLSHFTPNNLVKQGSIFQFDQSKSSQRIVSALGLNKKGGILLAIVFLLGCFSAPLKAQLLTPVNDSCGTILNFDGVDDYVELSDVLPIGNGSHTVELWIKVPTVGTQGLLSTERVGIILGNVNLHPSTNWEIHNQGQLRIYWNGGEIDILGTVDLRDNLWHHVAFVRNTTDNTLKSYIDGVLDINFSSAGTNINFGSNHRIGGDNRAVTGGPSFHGAMDELRIWNVAKTQAELTSLSTSNPNGTEADLVSYFNFDEGRGAQLIDLKGAIDGVLTSMDTVADWSLLNGNAPCVAATSFFTVTEIACGSYTWARNGMTYSTTGVYHDTIAISATSDLIISLDLTISNESSASFTVNDSNSYTWQGMTLTLTGMYFDTIPNAAGCDSLMTLNLTITNDNSVSFTRNDSCSTILNFDGVDDYVELSDVLPIGNGSHTVELWMKVPTVGTQGLLSTERVGIILGNVNLHPSTNWEVTNQGRLRIYWNGGQIDILGTVDLRDNLWHHVAFVRNTADNTLKSYIDGVPDINFSSAGTNINFGSNHRIGGDNRAVTGGPSFHGAMDELRIWNVAKTQAELTSLSTSNPNGTETDLVSYFNFDEGRGSQLIDLKSGIDGVLTSMDTVADWSLLNGNTPCAAVTSSFTVTETVCDSYTWPRNGMTYSTTGVYHDTVAISATSDLIISLNLVIKTSTSSVTVADECNSYVWQGMTLTTTGTYFDTIPNAAGCDSLMTLNLIIRTSTSSVTVADECNSYVWQGMTLTTTGTYFDTIPNAAGCDSLMTLNLTIDTVNLGITQNGFVLTANQAGATYQWLDCNNGNAQIAGATSQNYTATSNGDYAVEVTLNSCIDTSSCINVLGVGIETQTQQVTIIKLYPNPTRNSFTIEIDQELNYEILQIYNLTGKLVKEQQIQSSKEMIDVSEFAEGIYMIKYGNTIQKLVVTE